MRGQYGPENWTGEEDDVVLNYVAPTASGMLGRTYDSVCMRKPILKRECAPRSRENEFLVRAIRLE